METRKIEVIEYDASWPEKFRVEKAALQATLGDIAIAIEHIGSTAVINLPAKPVIDILIEVQDIESLDNKTARFNDLNYDVKGEHGIAGRRFYSKGGNHRSHHIHAFETGSHGLFRHRAFRDYLVAHPEIAQDYGTIKKHAALHCRHDNDTYIALKNSFIVEHEKRATQWYGVKFG